MKLKVTGRAFKNLKSLGQDRMAEIDSRLLAGEPASVIVNIIHNEWGKLKSVKPQTLKKMLERYRETELREKTIERIANAQRGTNLSVIQKRLNAMEELEQMARIQYGRIQKLLMQEEKMPAGIVNKQVNPEMRLFKEMIVELGKLQLETGVLARAPKTIKGSMVGPGGEIQEFEWTEEQSKMLSELEELLNRDESAAAV